MRYLLIDRILEWQPHESIVALKNVTMSEDFLEFHFPRFPVMPGVLLLEAITQAAAWLEAASSEFENWLLLESVRQSKFYGFALPGDQVRIEVEFIGSESEDTRVIRGTGKVEGERRISAEIEARVAPMLDVESPEEQRLMFHALTRELGRLTSQRKRRKK